jgi:hypothetical protein
MDELHDAVELAARIGGGPEITYRIPESAAIRLDDRHDGSHLLAGATITHWPTRQPEEINR